MARNTTHLQPGDKGFFWYKQQINIINKYVTDKTTSTTSTESDTGPRVLLRLPYTGHECVSVERQVQSVVRCTFGDVNVVTVYNSQRAFTVRKDVLPTQLIGQIIYAFECRHCASRYMDRTVQHLNARIRQHVPLHLLSVEQRVARPKRGRPPKKRATTTTLSS